MAKFTVIWIGLLAALRVSVSFPLSFTSPSPSMTFSLEFSCRYAGVTTLRECLDPSVHGLCSRTTEECLARWDHNTGQVFGPCCCSNLSTPVESIIYEKTAEGAKKWSVWIASRNPEGQAGSGYCAVLACARPWSAERCPDGSARCVPEKALCGFSRTRGSRCDGPQPPASPSRKSGEDCCTADVGGICTWMNGPRPTLPNTQPCCLKFEENCGKGCRLGWVLLSLAVAMPIAGALVLQRWIRKAQPTAVLLVVVASLEFGLAFFANHLWWEITVWTCYSFGPLFLWCLPFLLRSCRKRLHQDPTTLSKDKDAVNIAILILIEKYVSPHWPSSGLQDESMADLHERLEKLGWTVWPVRDPKFTDFSGVVKFIRGKIEGTTGSKVLVYVSGHCSMIYGLHWIIPADGEAGCFPWRDWISLNGFMRAMNRMEAYEAVNAHFIVLVNGCRKSSRLSTKFWWLLRNCLRFQAREEERLSSDQADFTLFFPCDPGQEAFYDTMTKAFEKALSDNPSGNLDEIFRVICHELRPERSEPSEACLPGEPSEVRPRQHPWIHSSCPVSSITLEVTGCRPESFQSTSRSSPA